MHNNTHPLEQDEVMAYLDGELIGELAVEVRHHFILFQWMCVVMHLRPPPRPDWPPGVSDLRCRLRQIAASWPAPGVPSAPCGHGTGAIALCSTEVAAIRQCRYKIGRASCRERV